MDHLIWVFFYGSYINLDVLKEEGLIPGQQGVATLSGFDIRIEPRANLIRNQMSMVYGILVTATHDELDRLYTDHAKDKLGEVYLPEAVVALDNAGRLRPALTYIAPEMNKKPAEKDYVERIVIPAEKYGFLGDYIAKLRGFVAENH